MPRKLHLLTVIFFTCCTFILTKSNAQHCAGASGSGVCTPLSGITQMGFFPPDTSLPCFVIGQPSDQTINFHTPPTAQGYTLNWVQVRNIERTPCGLCWRSNDTQDRVAGNATGCVRITGTTYDAPGQYGILVYADANVTVGFIPFTVQNLNLDSVMGLHYYLRVRHDNEACPPVDTLLPSLERHPIGTAPTPTITGNSSVCPGATTTLGISGGTYYAYAWSTGEHTATIQGGAGTYSVTAYANCASATATKTINSTQLSPQVSANGATTFCTGGSVTLNAGSGYSAYSWSNGSTSQSINVTQSGSYTVTVTQNGCTAASNATVVNVTGNPSPTITAGGPTTFCQGNSVTLDAGAGYSSYAWSNGETTQSITATTAGTYTATVTQSGCSGTSNTVTVTVGNPTATITPSRPTTFCQGGSVSLDAGAGYSAYSWNTGATTQSINVTTSGTYLVTVTQAGCNGTSNTVTVTVSGSTLNPVLTASNGLNICNGGSTTLDAGSGYTSYLWNGGSTSQTLSATATGTYTVTVTQGACTGTVSANVTLGTFPVTINLNPATDPTICEGETVTLDAGAGHASYAWSNGATTQSIDVTDGGGYIVTVTDNNACSGSVGSAVTVVPTPSPVITPSGSQTLCSGETLTLDAGSGFDTYSWSNGDNTQTSSVSGAGSYSVTVTLDGCTGSSSAPVAVTVNQTPTTTISPSGTFNICTGQSVTFDAGAGFASYLWSNGATTQTIAADATGTYSVTVTQNGCDGASGNQPTVFANVTPNAVVTELGTANGQTVLEATPANATYAWYLSNTQGDLGTLQGTATQRDTVECGDVAQFVSVVVSQNGCADTSTAATVVCAGIGKVQELATFSLMPNPTNDVLNIRYELNDNATVKLSVVDLAGRVVIDLGITQQAKGIHQQVVNVAGLAQGIYMLNFNTGRGQYNSKFVKQ